jgi:hypothetical protein
VPAVLVISFTDLARDPRVNRQILALRRGYDVIAAGGADPQVEDVRFVACPRAARSAMIKAGEAARLLLGSHEGYYWRQAHIAAAREKLRAMRADVLIANDIDAVPVALEVAKGSPVILDAHEYSPGEYETLRWRLLKRRYTEHLLRAGLPRIAGMMTVAEGIAREYARNFGVEPVVVHNAPAYHDLSPTPARPGAIRMIHHGNAMRARRIEHMLEVMRSLDDRFTLDLMLIPADPGYLASLKRAAAHDKRIRFLDPVPMRELVRFANAYDVGLYLLEPSSFNNLHALPNKFFEFVQSRLAVAIGPSPEMAALAERHGFGVVARDFLPLSLARALSALDAGRINDMKARAHAAARELCFERAEEALLALVSKVIRR